MFGFMRLLRRLLNRPEPVEFEAGVIWQHVGQPEYNFLICVPKGNGLEVGDPVRVVALPKKKKK